MDFLSQSSSLLGSQAHNLPLQICAILKTNSGFQSVKKKTENPFIRLKIHSAHNAGKMLNIQQKIPPSSPTYTLFRLGSNHPMLSQGSRPSDLSNWSAQTLTRARQAVQLPTDSLLVCKPRPDNQGADSSPLFFFVPDWYFKYGLEYKYRRKIPTHHKRIIC